MADATPDAARRLSDEEWFAISATAKASKLPLTPDADTRAEIDRCLFVEHPAFHYDAKREAAAYERGRRMLRHCKALADLYGETPSPFEDINHERNLYFIERLRRSAFALVMRGQAIRRANKGHHNTQRELLISRLCGIWLDNFHARDLTVTVPGSGGQPEGPLIKFLLAAMRLVLPTRGPLKRRLPDPEALRKAIDRERRGRENARQLRLDLRQRGEKPFMFTKKNRPSTLR